MSGRGGRRSGAGRKSKAEEQGLQRLLAECIPVAQRKRILRQLGLDAVSQEPAVREPARKLALAYLYGTPKQMVELSGELPLLVLDGRPPGGDEAPPDEAPTVPGVPPPVDKPVRVKKPAPPKR